MHIVYETHPSEFHQTVTTFVQHPINSAKLTPKRVHGVSETVLKMHAEHSATTITHTHTHTHTHARTHARTHTHNSTIYGLW